MKLFITDARCSRLYSDYTLWGLTYVPSFWADTAASLRRIPFLDRQGKKSLYRTPELLRDCGSLFKLCFKKRYRNRMNAYFNQIKAIPHNDRLTALRAACLHIFRHLAQILLEIRQYYCIEFMQADEISDCAIHTQSLCDLAL